MNSAAAPGGPGARWRQQLPADVSPFIGRNDELAMLCAMLPGARLVTVTGPGGVGKTRLALRSATGVCDRYPDGMCLAELAGLTDEELLPAAVAQCLGLHGNHGHRSSAAVLDELRGKRLLLILDTCEHLIAGSARFAAQVLREAAEVTILTTSRQPLRLASEQVLRLGPLPVPAAGGGLARGDAVELFAMRAAAALPGFTVNAATLPDVLRLCRQLDGLPLAIELAAVRVRALPLAELANRLEDSSSLLSGARRGTVARHQTLRAAIGWSYDLCTEEERAVWDRLSVFCGSFDLAVARKVAACSQVPEHQVGDVLAGLVEKSVVLTADELPFSRGDSFRDPWVRRGSGPVNGSGTGSVSGRYRLPGCAREQGAERLARAVGQEADCRRRHASWYLEMARDFERHLVADDQPVRLARLRTEHANIRAALAYGFADRDADPGPGRGAARLAGVLLPYWLMSGRLREGIHWQATTLALFGEPSPERASALANRAMLGAMLGSPTALADAREAIAMAARLGDDRTHARGYLALQAAFGFAGAYPQALEAGTQARRHLEALGADIALRCLDVQLAQTHQLAGNFPAALSRCERVLDGLGQGERWLHGCVHIISALALYQQPGRQAESARAAGEALLALRELDDLLGEAYALEVLGWLAAGDGRPERAAWMLGAAQALWDRAGGRLSGNPAMEGYHSKSAGAAADALGAERYAELHACGAARPLAQIVSLAVGDVDSLPGVPDTRGVRDSIAGLPAVSAAGRPGADGPGADGLTGRERQVCLLVASGLTNREIARRLVISQRTVEAHVNHIFAKLGVSSRVQLTRRLSDQVTRALPGKPSPDALMW